MIIILQPPFLFSEKEIFNHGRGITAFDEMAKLKTDTKQEQQQTKKHNCNGQGLE